MSSLSGETRTERRVAVVADGTAVDRYVDWLQVRWPVKGAESGNDSLSLLESEPAVLVVDRNASGLHPDRLLGIANERQLDSQVVMLTPVEPGPEPVRLGFDDHLVKPVTRDALVGAVERGFRRAEYEQRLSRFYELAARKAAMEAGRIDPTDEAAYRQLREQVSAARSSVEDAFERLDDDDISKVCNGLSRRDGSIGGAAPDV
ncbi:MAG: HalX domain-containing protein [Halobacteriales archaeon]